MKKIKIYIFNKLTDLIFTIIDSSYYKNKQSLKANNYFKNIGENCNIHPQSSLLNPQYIYVGDNFRASWNLRLEAIDYYKGQKFTPQITIGNNVSFNTDIHIGCINHINIGDNCLFASRIFISDHDHGDTTLETVKLAPAKRLLHSKGPVVIGDNCWIGERVAILSGVTIGKNSIIASNSVVTKNIPEFCIAAGIPAKVIKKIN